MYPLHMKTAGGGFAVANDEDEHRTLSAHDYEPKLVEAKTKEPQVGSSNDPAELDELTTLRAEAKAAGVKSAHLMGADKLRAALGK